MPQNQLSKLVASTDLGEATTWVGQQGTLFWDPATTTLRISDGSTAGGVTVGGGLGLSNANVIDTTQIVSIAGHNEVGVSQASTVYSQLFWTGDIADLTATKISMGMSSTAFNWLYTEGDGTWIQNFPNGQHSGPGGGYTWKFDNNGALNLPGSNWSFPWVRSTGTYPTIIADGPGGHGGPELDWADTILTGDNFNDSAVLRHSMFINDEEGLKIIFNANEATHPGTSPKVEWSFTPDGTFHIPNGTLAPNGTDVQLITTVADSSLQIMTNQSNYTWNFDNNGNLTFPTPGNSTVSNSVGYLGLPQHSYANGTYNVHNYDQGKHIYLTHSSTATFNMPSNSDIPFPVGTTIMVVTGGSTTAYIKMEWAQEGDADQIIQAVTGNVVDGSNSSSAFFTLAPYGMATLLKIGDTTWMISGAGLS